MIKKIAPCSVLVLAWLLPAPAADDFAAQRDSNWHHWRGPRANGFAPQADPPVSWDEKTNIKWRSEIPAHGSSTPIVWGKRIFLLTARDTGRPGESTAKPAPGSPRPTRTKRPTTYYEFLVHCVDRENGQPLWKRIAVEAVPHEGYNGEHGYASGSPTTDGQRLYASFGSQGVYCYDFDGQLIWKRDLGDMYTRFGWGEASTPVVHGDRLIVNWDNEVNSAIYVLDAKTGETRWKADRDEVTSWATPLVLERDGKVAVIVGATRRATSYDLETGKTNWECGGLTFNVIPSPVATEKLAICMSNWQGSAIYAIPLGARGDITDSKEIAWKRNTGAPYVPSPLLYGEHLYFTESTRAKLTCLKVSTGEPLIDRQSLPGLRDVYASPLGAAGRVYIVGRDGTTLVLKHPASLEVLATNKLDDRVDASPVAVGGELFLRGKRYLYCVARK